MPKLRKWYSVLILVVFVFSSFAMGTSAATKPRSNSPARYEEIEDYTKTWLGNTFKGGGKKWVQSFIKQMVVEEDGSCYTDSHWDEGGNERGVYKDGNVTPFGKDKGKEINAREVKIGDTKWSISGNTVKSSSGKEIKGLKSPTALGIERLKNYLMVADDGKGEHIIKFYDVSGTPVLKKTFGTKGGIRSGIPGEVTPTKFWGITGCGTDAKGNIYISCSQNGCFIRSFTPDGTKLRWEVYGQQFCDCGDFVPGTDGKQIYVANEYYEMDYNKPEGQQWSFKRYTMDVDKYPNDPRATEDNPPLTTFVRIIQGKTFLFTTDMNMYKGLNIFKFNFKTDGYIAIPSGNLPFESPEGVIIPGFFIDSKANIWTSRENAYYVKRCLGVDAKGDLIYAPVERFCEVPAPFNSVQDWHYDDENDVMYMGGGTDKYPTEGWGHAAPVVARYSKWSKPAERKLDWAIKVPFHHNDEPNVDARFVPVELVAAGDKLFLQYGNRDKSYFCQDGESGVTRVYNSKDGSYIGRMLPDGAGGVQGSWVDLVEGGIKAIKRSNGEYLILREENWKSKQIIYRWKPKAYTADQTPDIKITVPAPGAKLDPVSSLTVKADASVRKGSITKVEFLADLESIGIDTNGKDGWSVEWSNLLKGEYTLYARATADNGAITTSESVKVFIPAPPGPFTGAPAAIPGKVEAENFDGGYEGKNYHDNDSKNESNLYRSEGVDIIQPGDADGGYAVNLRKGEWISYTVDIKEKASYYIGARVSAPNGGSYKIKLGDKDVTGTVKVSSTEQWVTSSSIDVPLASGKNVLTLVCDSGELNIDYFEVLKPMEPENPANLQPGLKYEYYEGLWYSIPDFTNEKIVKTGTVKNIDLSQRSSDDKFAFRFKGYVDIREAGVYTFYTGSDDGSRLYIGSVQVVNNDGTHGAEERSGKAYLKAGKHPITVDFFEAEGGEELWVSYEGPSINKCTIPDTVLFYN